jgi:ankyrin repeat protein
MSVIYTAIVNGKQTRLRKLLENPENCRNINVTRGSIDGSLLLTATKYKNDDAVLLLLEKGADPNIASPTGITPLITACKQCKITTIAKLIEYGANVSYINATGSSPLTSACSIDRLDIIDMLLKNGANINSSAAGLSPIGYCLSNNKCELALELISRGASCNTVSNAIFATIMSYVIEREDYRALRIMMENGGNPNSRFGELEMTAIIYFAFTANKEMVEYMISRGADVNLRDKHECNALGSITKYDESLAKILIEAGSSSIMSTKTNLSILHSAANAGTSAFYADLVRRFPDDINVDFIDPKIQKMDAEDKVTRPTMPITIALVSDRTDIVEILIDGGADISRPNHMGVTLLEMAMAQRNKYMVNRLIDLGVSPITNHTAQTHAFHRAALYGDFVLMDKLLMKGYNINVRDIYYETPLFVPVYNNDVKTVDFMLTRGVDIHAVNKDGYNVTTIASSNNREEILKLLLAMGGKINCISLYNMYRKSKMEERANKKNTTKSRVCSAQESSSVAKPTLTPVSTSESTPAPTEKPVPSVALSAPPSSSRKRVITKHTAMASPTVARPLPQEIVEINVDDIAGAKIDGDNVVITVNDGNSYTLSRDEFMDKIGWSDLVDTVIDRIRHCAPRGKIENFDIKKMFMEGITKKFQTHLRDNKIKISEKEVEKRLADMFGPKFVDELSQVAIKVFRR